MAIKRSCYLCGSQYSYCDCTRQPKFMATFCSENCRDIFKSLCLYGTNAIAAEDCKELLDCCDLSNKDSFRESTRNTIEKIYATSVVKEPEVVEELEVIEEAPVEEIQVEVPTFKRQKRNHEVVIEDIQ